MTIIVGVSVTSREAAIVQVEREGDLSRCTAILRPRPDLPDLLEAIDGIGLGIRDRLVVDAGGGTGGALWRVLRRDRHHVAVTAQGRARQQLCDALIAAIATRTLSFAPGLEHEGEMRRSLTRFRREVGEDGVLGDTLATALAIALDAEVPMVGRVH